LALHLVLSSSQINKKTSVYVNTDANTASCQYRVLVLFCCITTMSTITDTWLLLTIRCLVHHIY